MSSPTVYSDKLLDDSYKNMVIVRDNEKILFPDTGFRWYDGRKIES
jgi:hypothetical protein